VTDARKYHITLVLGWTGLGEAADLRRNTTGFAKIKALVEQTAGGSPLKLNAFLYAFLCSAKNIDLFLRENTGEIAGDVQRIAADMTALEDLERDAITPDDPSLHEKYLKVRQVAARANARDEQRALATLLFSGPSTGAQIADDLAIGENLAIRVLRALAPIVAQPEQDTAPFVLRSDPSSLAITLHLLRYTLGIDPIRVLQARIAADKGGVKSGST